MSKTINRLALVCVVFITGMAVIMPDARAGDGLQLSFLGEGQARLSFRYRYESVDQQGLPNTAHASTLRTRLTYATPEEQAVSLVLEADNVLRLGGALYSDGNSTRPGYPVVADPTGTEINQAFLRIAPGKDASVSIGRQRIGLDDQRIIGRVAWRQNEQTYDAFSSTLSLPGNARLLYGYLWNINRIFGPEGGAQASDWNCQCHLLNLATRPWRDLGLVLFAYSLDIEDAPAQASRTLGLRIAGTQAFDNDIKLDYLFSFARQSDVGDNPVDYQADYLHGRVEIGQGTTKGKAGLEILQGDAAVPGSQFLTPLATLHAFNGWADKFLSTPDAGLRDLYLGFEMEIAGLPAAVVWHRFTADDGGADYGKEWNLSVAKKFNDKLSVLGKFADYQSDTFASDTRKFWLMLSYAP